ncbi:hypothetical protein [Silvibacterium sp.]|uniref:hypothetical protein n=1 Tax=Silvibacterium sp. TaxID=1964179 RepID=UPI0039E63B59
MTFKRRLRWLGKLVSEEGFTLHYGNRSVYYADARGVFQFGFEDALLFPKPHQVAGDPVTLEASELEEVMDRVIRGIRFDGHTVDVYRSRL